MSMRNDNVSPEARAILVAAITAVVTTIATKLADWAIEEVRERRKEAKALAAYKAVEDPGFANIEEAFAKLEVHEAAASELAKAKADWDASWKRLFEVGRRLGSKSG